MKQHVLSLSTQSIGYVVHIYVEHKDNDNAEEADVGEFEEENVGGVKQVEEDNVGGVEHVEEANVGDVEQIEEDNVGGVEQFKDTEDNDDSDFEPDGLSFDDSEHERDPGLDDCFDFIENQVEEKGKRGRIKVATRKHNHTPKKVPIGVDNVGSCGVVDNEIIINYASDELGSSDSDASDEEKEPKYPSSATSKWVAKMVAARMTSSDGVKIRDIVFEIKSNFSAGITMSRTWKAKQIAKALIEGDAVKQYNLLWRYSTELRRVNSGNTCKINLTRVRPTIQPRFGNFYFCLDGLKKGFTTSCRPFIGVDECHLNTKFGGTLLILVGRDPNDQYYSIAFSVCENETKESWRWFLTLLLEDIGKKKRWVFISDQ
ncbi:hypothetical protein KIW84_050078 [Lathyrus oleraceus]|uniref:MULE transposase domain-containing protein n=1 Tax=Pisum sativum TaxID=3888 RepID=A0A9D4WGH4_PEA|nr:hypothetical protein KIW84_050078 [Pisum sativum]